MSLAATLNSSGMRPASFLPTIKCSSCGNEIEISAMGEHICGKASRPSTSAHSSMSSNTHSSMSSNMSSMFSIRQANANAPSQPSPLQFGSGQPPQTRVRAPTVDSSQMSPPKPPRTAPPRVNTDVANQPFLAPTGQMDTPISPALSSRSGSSAGSKPLPPLRSMTSPMPRLWDPRPPSPELSANLDCAFPPFPTAANPTSRPGTANGRTTPSERGGSRNGSRPDIYNTEPRSPMSSAGENVMNRMNTLKNGPFDPNRRRPSNDTSAPRGLKDMKRRPSLPSQSFNRNTPSPPPELPQLPKVEPELHAPLKESPTDASDLPPAHAQSTKRQAPERPARPVEEFSPAFFDELNSQPDPNQQALKPPVPIRSMTTPAPSDSNTELAALPLTKFASEPVIRPDTASSSNLAPEPSSVPPRGQSSNPDRTDARMQDAPPVPKPVQLHRSDSKHKPSGSGSSTASSVPSLGNSNSDSGASPIGSAASSVDVLSPLSYQVGRYGEDKDMRPAGLNVKSQQNPGMRAEHPNARAPPARNFARPAPPKEITLPAAQPPATPESSSWPLESPMDPAMRNQRFGNTLESPTLGTFPGPRPMTPKLASAVSKPTADDYDPYRAPSPQPPPSGQQRRPPPRSKTDAYPQSIQPQRPVSPFRSKTDTDLPSRLPQKPLEAPLQPPSFLQAPPIPQEAPKPSLQRQPTAAGAKSRCRGCNLQIEGKSVKAADGGLTGRWHKACFVCKTCREPFTTTDFYVINNQPYCEQHYHEKNGSVCSGCRKGIEGQYLETTSSGPNGRIGRKYHRRCFTCVDCRTVLSDDYFEIGGRVFCERHALANMRGQARPPGAGPPGLAPHGGSSLKAERRRTRLMNI